MAMTLRQKLNLLSGQAKDRQKRHSSAKPIPRHCSLLFSISMELCTQEFVPQGQTVNREYDRDVL